MSAVGQVCDLIIPYVLSNEWSGRRPDLL